MATEKPKPTEAIGENVDPLEIDAAPVITLGVHVLAILEMRARKNRVVTPIILDMMEIFLRAFQASQDGNALALRLSEDEFDKFIKVVAIGASSAHPQITEEVLLDWKFGTLELIQGVVAVATQSGLMPKKAEPDPLALAPAAAPAIPAEPTGTSSQPKSPSIPDGPSTTS